MAKKPLKTPPLDRMFADLTRFKSFWILDDDRQPKVAESMDEWYAFVRRDFEDRSRVGDTETATMRVSTVFLGVDHSWRGPPPILFETMVFSLEKYPREFEGKIYFAAEDFDTVRYSTWSDAEAGHAATVRRIQKAEADALAGMPKKGKTSHGRT